MRVRICALAILCLVGACSAPEQADTGTRNDAARLSSPATGSGETGAAIGSPEVSEKFELGRHYLRLTPTQPTSSGPSEIEVALVFSFDSVDCFDFEPYLRRWAATAPGHVRLIRIPEVREPAQEAYARAFYTAEALGKADAMRAQFYREILTNGRTLDSEDGVRELFVRNGVDEQAFKTAYDSFEVYSKVQAAAQLDRRYRISSVPTVVVNGKYTSTPAMAGGNDALIELIGELVESQRTPSRR